MRDRPDEAVAAQVIWLASEAYRSERFLVAGVPPAPFRSLRQRYGKQVYSVGVVPRESLGGRYFIDVASAPRDSPLGAGWRPRNSRSTGSRGGRLVSALYCRVGSGYGITGRCQYDSAGTRPAPRPHRANQGGGRNPLRRLSTPIGAALVGESAVCRFPRYLDDTAAAGLAGFAGGAAKGQAPCGSCGRNLGRFSGGLNSRSQSSQVRGVSSRVSTAQS